MTATDHAGDPIDPHEIDAPGLSKSGRRRQRTAGYSGLRVDEYGYDPDGAYYPALDGGSQE